MRHTRRPTRPRRPRLGPAPTTRWRRCGPTWPSVRARRPHSPRGAPPRAASTSRASTRRQRRAWTPTRTPTPKARGSARRCGRTSRALRHHRSPRGPQPRPTRRRTRPRALPTRRMRAWSRPFSSRRLAGAGRPPRGTFQNLTLPEAARMVRFQDLMRRLREAEPNNPQLTYFAQPNTVPSEVWLARLQAELAAALARVRPVEGPPPPPLVPGTLTPRPGDGAPDQPDPNTERERASLRRNMQIAGTMQRNDTREAHHVVPGSGPMSGGRSAVAAQQQLARFGVSLQSATNGVALSPKSHREIHTRGYYNYI